MVDHDTAARAAEPEILSVERVAFWRNWATDMPSKASERAGMAALCDSHERLRAEVADARAPVKLDQVPNGCWVACIAGITGLSHDDLAAFVPQHDADGYKDPNYHNAVNAYTRSRGWRLAYIGPDIPRGYSIASGLGARGLYHSVIALDGRLWHDPHPSRAGLKEIEQYEIMIPLIRPAAARSSVSPESR